jgi:hypothetical protein
MTTQSIKFTGWTRRIVAVFIVLTAGLLLAWPVWAVVKPGAKYAGGNMTLEAKNATVGEVLETLARTAGVDIFVTRGFQTAAERITLQIADEPIEDAIRRILRGYNYAAIYVKEGDDFRIAALKIYPEGQQGGEVVPLFSGGRTPIYEEKNRRGETVTVMVSSGGEVITHGGLGKKGLLVPSQSIPNPAVSPAATLNKPWFALQIQLESQEAAQYQDLLLLQKRLESAADPDLKKSLTMIYADDTAKFHAVKRANLSKIESLKRITQFREMTGQQ